MFSHTMEMQGQTCSDVHCDADNCHLYSVEEVRTATIGVPQRISASFALCNRVQTERSSKKTQDNSVR